MGKPYSLDPRERICAYVSLGHSARAAGRGLGFSAATAVQFVAEHRTRGTVVAKRQGRPPGRLGKLAPHLDFLLDIVRAEPDITRKELAAALSDTEDVQVQLSSLHRVLERAGLSHKKDCSPPNVISPRSVRHAGSGSSAVSRECTRNRFSALGTAETARMAYHQRA